MDYGYENLLWYEEQAESNATEKPADLMWIMIVICTVLMEPGGDRKDLCARIINCKSKGRVHRMYHRAVSVDVNYSKLATNKILAQYTDRHAHYVHMTQPK